MARRSRPPSWSRTACFTGVTLLTASLQADGFAPTLTRNARDKTVVSPGKGRASMLATAGEAGFSLPGLPGVTFAFGWGGHESRREKLQKIKASSEDYGWMENLVGPEKSDIRVADVPIELQDMAKGLLKVTGHLTRAGRITVLEALVRAYLSARKQPESRGSWQAQMSRVLSVARTLGDSEVDQDTIVACLLCDSGLQPNDVESEFGAGVANILAGHERMLKVEQEMEIRALMYDYAELLQGEHGDNLRNLLQSVANDWRAVTLRVAWKHVELDGPFASTREQSNACWAALNIYAVLAERAGMSFIKNSIEDRAFRFLMPEEYNRIVSELAERREQADAVLRQARTEILQMLREDAIFQASVERYEVRGRVKSPYSIWKKLQSRECSIDDIHDLVALRVLCTPATELADTPEMVAARGAELCKYTLAVVHKIRPHYKGRVKDYITHPKANGYQSLHTTLQMRLMGKGIPYEVQIRTHQMHTTAEYGLAAHFSYKGDNSLDSVLQQRLASRQPASPGEFMAWLSQVLAESQVYVWGPHGKLMNVSKGATMLDVIKQYCRTSATHYQLSKKVGKKVLMGKKALRQYRLNGRRAVLGRQLQSGDVISSV